MAAPQQRGHALGRGSDWRIDLCGEARPPPKPPPNQNAGPEVERARLMGVLARDRLHEGAVELYTWRRLDGRPAPEVEVVRAGGPVVVAKEVRERVHVLEVEAPVGDLPGPEEAQAQARRGRVAELGVDVAAVEADRRRARPSPRSCRRSGVDVCLGEKRVERAAGGHSQEGLLGALAGHCLAHAPRSCGTGGSRPTNGVKASSPVRAMKRSSKRKSWKSPW